MLLWEFDKHRRSSIFKVLYNKRCFERFITLLDCRDHPLQRCNWYPQVISWGCLLWEQDMSNGRQCFSVVCIAYLDRFQITLTTTTLCLWLFVSLFVVVFHRSGVFVWSWLQTNLPVRNNKDTLTVQLSLYSFCLTIVIFCVIHNLLSPVALMFCQSSILAQLNLLARKDLKVLKKRGKNT